MDTVDKVTLLTKRFGVEAVDIPGVGTVQVRPLSRAEALQIQGTELPVAEMERRLLALALVSPSLNEDEVGQWQANSPAGELQPVVQAIVRLSGMEAHADKAAYQQFRE
ncbi:MAG: hypothetical protein AB7L91_18060 [Dehalococcoidia bacterium]